MKSIEFKQVPTSALLMMQTPSSSMRERWQRSEFARQVRELQALLRREDRIE
jgi:hypothetical protein